MKMLWTQCPSPDILKRKKNIIIIIFFSVINREALVVLENIIVFFAFTHIPIPSQTGIWRLEPRYETKITVMTFPISYMEAMIPDIELGIS